MKVSTKDLGAACVGALASLPQAVAFGLIAVSPLGPEWAAFGIAAGVATSFLAGSLNGGLSSHPFLISGPAAVTALVFAVAVQAALARGYDPQHALVLAYLAVIVGGLFQLAAGLLRLGKLVSYVPVPVLAGFVSASALIVLFSSLPMVLGLPEMSFREVVEGGIARTDFWAVAVGGATIVGTLALEGRTRPVPAVLLGLVAGAVLFHLGVGLAHLPRGPEIGMIDLTSLLHRPAILDMHPTWAQLWRDADIPLLSGLSMGLLAAFMTVMSGGALEPVAGVRAQANHDLRVHGAVNLLMGALGLLPVSGAVSRTQAIINAGAETRLANLGAAVLLLVMVVVLAPGVSVMPLWATSGMLVVTALQAIDRPTLRKLRAVLFRAVPYRRVHAGDVGVTLAVVATGLAFNLVAAVGVGMAFAVVLFVLGMGRDPVRRVYLGERVHSRVQRPEPQMAVLEREGHRIAVIELQGALFFGSSAALEAQAADLRDSGVAYLILDFRHLTAIDSTGAATIRGLAHAMADAGGRLLLSCIEAERRVNPKVRRRHAAENNQHMQPMTRALRWVWLNLQANGVIAAIGDGAVFDDTESALAASEDALLARLGAAARPGTRGTIAGSRLFAGLGREQIIALAGYSRRHRFAIGDTVFSQGDVGDRAYFLVAGRMDVLIDIPGSQRKRRVSSLAEGTLFAEMGLLDGGPRSATVRAVRPSTCISIDAAAYARLQAEMPEVAHILMRNLGLELAARLRLANEMISELEQ